MTKQRQSEVLPTMLLDAHSILFSSQDPLVRPLFDKDKAKQQ
jgi:hypothetical protein